MGDKKGEKEWGGAGEMGYGAGKGRARGPSSPRDLRDEGCASKGCAVKASLWTMQEMLDAMGFVA